MVRKGKYTRTLSPFDGLKRSLRRKLRWFTELSRTKKFLVIALPILIVLIIIPLATYLYFARDISNQERLMNRNNTGIVLLDKNGEDFYSTGRADRREIVPLDQIADSAEHALIAAEDKGFYEHGGFSIPSILGALYANLISGDSNAYGGSTITQQLAKNTLLSNDRTFFRKYQELAISIAIEREYTKDQILEMYLNSVYYGEGAFGIKDASETYFNKQPSELSLAESSILIGILPAPSAYSPISGDKELTYERQNTVLSRMVDEDYITENEKTAAKAEVVAVAEASPNENGIAPHFAEMVLAELYDRYGEETVTRSGYQVKTTLDLNLQKSAIDSINKQIPYINSQGGSNASVVAIDPTSGEIRALVGSADWNNEDFGKVNMATSPRQPGSSFKPVYYAEALALGQITPATIIKDEPIDINGYKPQNADRRFRGNVTVRSALAQSLNIPSVKVMQDFGVQEAVAVAERMGVTTLDSKAGYGLSFALGSAEIPLTEMTNIYAAFANQGQQFEPTIVKSIDDKFSRTIFKAREDSQLVLSPQGAYLISSILADNSARAPIFGSSLSLSGRQAAVKTGTTDDQRDAWTIGYTSQIAVGVWVGNNDNQAMLNGGSGMAGPIWRSVMQAGLQASPVVSFAKPNGVEEILICYGSGQRAASAGDGVYNEYFLTTAQPTGVCNVPDPVKEDEKNKKDKKDEATVEEEPVVIPPASDPKDTPVKDPIIIENPVDPVPIDPNPAG